MKENLKNEILSAIFNLDGLESLPIDLQIIVERKDKKTEFVEISIIRKDGKKQILVEKETKNGFAWCSALIMTVAKVRNVNTTVLVTDSL